MADNTQETDLNVAPGQFSDGTGPTAEEREQMEEESREAVHQKEELILELEKTGKINSTYANLLFAIHSATGGGRHSELRKVQVALESRERELPVTYSVNVGGGVDWQWPVACGVREVDLVDNELSKEKQQELIESIRQFDEAAIVEDNRVTFGVDFGNGKEQITVNMLQMMIEDYSAEKPLDGVFESHGPTKNIVDISKTPVAPAIAKQLHNGSIICNVDYDNSSGNSPSGLMNLIEVNGDTLFEVADTEALQQVSYEAIIK